MGGNLRDVLMPQMQGMQQQPMGMGMMGMMQQPMQQASFDPYGQQTGGLAQALGRMNGYAR